MTARARAEIVGRDQELELLEAVLEAGRPTFVAICAEPGRGKSTLLRALDTRATARGWHVVWTQDHAGTVTPETTPASFVERLLDTLGVPIATITRSAGIAGMLDSAFARVIPALEGTLAAVDPRQGSGLLSRWLRPDPLVVELGRRAPLLLVVDDLRPGATFVDWFTQTLVRGLRRSDAAVVVAASMRSSVRQQLLLEPDELVELALGPLDLQQVKDHLCQLSRKVTPPLTVSELDRYAAAASDEPWILTDLGAVLALDHAAPAASVAVAEGGDDA